MNRYVITRQAWRGREYEIAALFDEDRRLVEVLPEPADQESLLGNIYIGRVERIAKNLDAAFVSIAPGQKCYLPMEDVREPVFTRRLSGKKALAEGDELLVQVNREALKSKDPSVTTNLTLTGTYAVVSSGNRKLSVSAKLGREQRSYYLELLAGEREQWESRGWQLGAIVRTNAPSVPDDVVRGELAALAERLHSLIEKAHQRTCHSCLYRELRAYLRHLSDLRRDELEEVLTDDRGIFEELCGYYGIGRERLVTQGSVPVSVDCVETSSEPALRIRHYTDRALSLSALYGIQSGMEDALKERVWLRSGAYLVIQPTEALTVIDVNTGKNIAKRAVQENFLAVDKEAAREIARQLRLRNISGMILVDFINLTSREAEEELLSVFRTALKRDPVPAQVVDMTKLGLVEVTRRKVRRSLREMLDLRPVR